MSKPIDAKEIMKNDSRINLFSDLFNDEVTYITNHRIDRTTVPEGFYAYDIRHDEDWGNPCTIEPNILVNHYGTILTNRPVEFEDARDPYVRLQNDQRESITNAI